MKIKSVHVLSSYKDHVVLVNNNGVLELPGKQLKVTHDSKKGAVKDFMKLVLADTGQQHEKVTSKSIKEMLRNFKADVISKDLVLSSKKKESFEGTNELAGIVFNGSIVHAKASDLKKSISKPDALYGGMKLSDGAREAIQKEIKKKHI